MISDASAGSAASVEMPCSPSRKCSVMALLADREEAATPGTTRYKEASRAKSMGARRAASRFRSRSRSAFRPGASTARRKPLRCAMARSAGSGKRARNAEPLPGFDTVAHVLLSCTNCNVGKGFNGTEIAAPAQRPAAILHTTRPSTGNFQNARFAPGH